MQFLTYPQPKFWEQNQFFDCLLLIVTFMGSYIATSTVSGSCPSLFPEDSKHAIHVTTVTQDGVRELKLIPRVSIDVRQWINI